MQATGATEKHLQSLALADLITRISNENGDHSQFTIHNSQFTISLAIPHDDVLLAVMRLRGAEIYYRIVNLLSAAAQPVSVSDIYAQTGANINHLRKLVKLDLIRFGSEEVWRDPLADRDFMPAQAPQLTTDQVRAWGRVKVEMIKAEERRQKAEVSLQPSCFMV